MPSRRQRSVLAVVVAVIAIALVVAWLEGSVPPLSSGTTMRSAASWFATGSTYPAVETIWLVVRAILGLYITTVFLVITIEVLGTWVSREGQ